MPDIRQQVVLEMQGIGADTVTILAQAAQELQGKFNALVSDFDKGDKTALELMAGLKGVAAGLAEVGKLAASEDAKVQAIAAALEKARVATEAFIEASNAALAKKDAEEAKLDAQAKKRLDDKAARDQKSVDDAVAAADKITQAKQREAKEIAQAAEKEAMAAIEATRAFEKTVIGLDQLAMSGKQLQSANIDKAFRDAAAAADLEDDELEKLNQAFKNQTHVINQQIHALDDLGTAQVATSAKTAAGAKNIGGFASKADEASDKMKRMGQNAMSVAYALDDIRYGFGAVVNNIPALAQAAGFTTAWAAGIAIVGIGVFELGKALAPAAKQWAQDMGLIEDVTKRTALDLDALKLKSEALTAKPYKLDVDYENLRNVNRLIDDLQAKIAAFEAGKRDKLTEEMAKEAKEATHAFGGGTYKMEQSVLAYANARGYQADPESVKYLAKLEKEIRELEKRRDGGFDTLEEYTAVVGAISNAKEQASQTRDSIRGSQEKWAKEQVGGFELGDPLAIQAMQARAAQRPDLFKNVGPGGVTAAEAIGNVPSTPGEMLRRIDLDEQEKERIAHEAETTKNWKIIKAREKKARDAAKSELEKRTSADVTRINPGVDDALQKVIFDRMKAGASEEQAMAPEYADLIETLRKRNVGEDAIPEVAKRIVFKAADSAQNLIKEGAQPKLDIAAARAALKEARLEKAQDREAATALRKLTAEQKKDHSAQTVEANKIDDTINPYIQNAFAENRLAQTQGGGMKEAQLKTVLTNQAQQFLRNNGQNPQLADEIVKKAFDDMSRQFLQNQATTNNAVASLVALIEHNIEVANRQGQVLMEQIAKMNGVGNNMNRGRARGPTGQVNFNGGG